MNVLNALAIVLAILLAAEPVHGAVSPAAARPAAPYACAALPGLRGCDSTSSCPGPREDIARGIAAAVSGPEPPAAATALPPSAGFADTQTAPVARDRPRNSVASLRQQGFKPAILLAGDLLLLVAALVFVLVDMWRRPRHR